VGYEKDTRSAYRNRSKAESYKKQQTENIGWARFTTWRERQFVEKALRKCKLSSTDRVLDIPCGTGILADVLSKFPSTIIASDISIEMIDFALKDYKREKIGGIAQTDITKTSFKKGTFGCVITLGLMHRLPGGIRKQALREITDLSNRFIIVSYSIDTPAQRIKQWLVRKVWPAYRSAPSPIGLQDIMKELNSNGLIVRKKSNAMPFLSSEVVFLLEKKR